MPGTETGSPFWMSVSVTYIVTQSMRADGMRKNRFHPVSARRRPLPGVLSAHRGPVPHHRAQQDLQAVPLALDGPWGLRSGPRWAPSRLPAGLLPGVKGRANTFYNRRLLGHEGSDEEERHAVRVGVLGPPRRHKRLGPHSEIQLSPEGLARADALGRTLPLQGSRQLGRLSAGERRDTDSRTAGVGAAAASREKTRQASVWTGGPWESIHRRSNRRSGQ